MAKASNAYLPHVDGLRGIAILAVVIFHAFPESLTGGFIGVDVFFVISGFLITGLVLREIEAGNFSLATFFARRIRRLAPAAIVVLFVTTLAALVVLMPDTLMLYGESLAATVALHANYYFADNSGYFDGASYTKPLLHMWSLAVEEQFYLVWPLVMLVLATRGRWLLVSVAVALLLVSLVHAELVLRRNPEFAFYSLTTRAAELLVGAVLAILVGRHGLGRSLSRNVGDALGLAGLAMVMVSLVVVNERWTFPGLTVMPACLGTALLILAGLHGESRIGRLLAIAPLRLPGLISYSLYLWHWPVIALATYTLERQPSVTEMSALVAASFALATLSLVWVERPFRRPGGALELSVRPAFGFVLASTALFAGIGLGMKHLKGLPQRYPADTQALLAAVERKRPLPPGCVLSSKEPTLYSFGECGAGAAHMPKLLLVGDSNAEHFSPFFEVVAKREGFAGISLSRGGCPPLPGYYGRKWVGHKVKRCAVMHREMIRLVETTPGLTHVILAARWPRHAREARLDAAAFPRLGARHDAAAASLEAQLEATVAWLRGRGLNVLIVDQIPDFADALPTRCVLTSDAASAGRCGIARAEAEGRMRATTAVLHRVATAHATGVYIYTPLDALCTPTRCPILIDGGLVYHDYGHLSVHGAEVLTRMHAGGRPPQIPAEFWRAGRSARAEARP
ncbi:MAG: acyltransferase family protein [Hyphomicrobiaceae bacterium]